MLPVVSRIILRYVAGALVAKGLLTADDAIAINTDPDLVELVTAGLGIAIGVDNSGRDAMELARDLSFIAGPTIISLIASSLVLLGLFWLHLRKEDRAAPQAATQDAFEAPASGGSLKAASNARPCLQPPLRHLCHSRREGAVIAAQDVRSAARYAIQHGDAVRRDRHHCSFA